MPPAIMPTPALRAAVQVRRAVAKTSEAEKDHK